MRFVMTFAILFGTLGLPPRPKPARRQPPAPVELVRRAIAAVGGDSALRSVRTIITDGATYTTNRGQEQVPNGLPSAFISASHVTRDRAGHRMRTESQFWFPGATQTTRSVTIVTNDAAMALFNGTRRVAPRAAQQTALTGLENFMPLQLLHMLDEPDSLSPAASRTVGGKVADGLSFTVNGAPVTFWFDRSTGLPAGQETVADDPILGDVTTTTVYSNWTKGQGIRVPEQIQVTGGRGDNTTIQRVVSINDTLADSLFAMTDSVLNAFRVQPPAPQPGQAAPVVLSEVAPNVWRAAGPGYNSMIVVQSNRLVLVEAPLSDAWTKALLDTIGSRFPDKPIAWVVNTHHHWDHSGGIRTVMAAGLPVVTREVNVDFIRSIGTAHKTVKPDVLSRGRRLPRIIGVADSMTLGSGDNRVTVYATETAQDGGAHLAAFVPGPGILFVSDILSPPPGGNGPIPRLSAGEIVALGQRLGITINKVVGGHGDVATMQAVTAAAK